MAISELIKYEGDNSTFIWKYPNEDFNNMTQLVVNESQEAVFFANGQAADTFGPGRYKLDAENIPILTNLINKVTGVSVFHCEVYFINKAVKMAVKWGTDERVRFVEPTLGVPIEIGASGEMNLAVSDGRKMLIKLVGTMQGVSWDEPGSGFAKSLQESFRPIISTVVKSNLSSSIKKAGVDIVDVDEHLSELSDEIRPKVSREFEEYGLSIPQFYITHVVLPEDDKNYQRIKDLHTVELQKRMASAEADVKITQAESKASYMTAEAEAEARIQVAQREAVLEAQTTETEVAKREAERKLIQAQADAEANKMTGFSEAAVMREKGYNEKDVIQADIQKAYAEGIGNMGSNIGASGGGGGGSVMGDMIGLGVGMAAMGAVAPQVGEMMKGLNPNNDKNSTSGGDEHIKCPKCGSILPPNAKFCLECGEKIEIVSPDEVVCPACGKRTPKGKYCIECGGILSKKCENCGADIPVGGKFCLECGTKVVSE